MPRWARLVRNSNSKAPASERADVSLDPGSYLHYVRDKRESLATAAQWSTGRRYKGLCVVIRGYDGGNISLSGLHCNVTARGPSPISSRRTLFLSPSLHPDIFSALLFLLFFFSFFPLSLSPSYLLFFPTLVASSVQPYLVLNFTFERALKNMQG